MQNRAEIWLHFLQTAAKDGSPQMPLMIRWTVFVQQPYAKIAGNTFPAGPHIAQIMFSVSVISPLTLEIAILDAVTALEVEEAPLRALLLNKQGAGRVQVVATLGALRETCGWGRRR